jgi:ABC-type cobalamin/Fe3+-siderophores transport system ATPase subunit
VSLQVADVRFGYSQPREDRAMSALVLHAVSLEVADGAAVGILGPNGSGKTTLLRLMGGAVRPWSGHVLLDGREMTSLSRRAIARRMAVVPQETVLTFDYTALEIVLMGRYPHLGAFEVEGPDDRAAAYAALDVTGTAALADRLFRTLSGGEKQRVVIASALAQLGLAQGDAGGQGLTPQSDSGERLRLAAATKRQSDSRNHRLGVGPATPRPAVSSPASLLLLDEPTASLDLRYQLEVASLLRRLRDTLGLTIVLSTHDLRLARAVCTRLVLLSRGRVIANGPTEEVLTPTLIGQLFDIDAAVAAPML